MNHEDRKFEFDRDGFVIVRGFLTANDLTELVHNLDRYIRDVVPGLPDADAFYEVKGRPETLKQLQRMERDPYFGAYRENPSWKSLARTLLGEPCEASGVEWFNKPPGTDHAT